MVTNIASPTAGEQEEGDNKSPLPPQYAEALRNYEYHSSKANLLEQYYSHLNPTFSDTILPQGTPRRCIYRRPFTKMINKKRIHTTIGCGECLYCKQRESYRRLNTLISRGKNKHYSYFVTLTQSNENYALNLSGKIRKLTRNLRYRFPDISYSGFSEDGPRTRRVHAHILLWSNEMNLSDSLTRELFLATTDSAGFKFIKIEPVEAGSLLYIAGYNKKFFVPTITSYFNSFKKKSDQTERAFDELLFRIGILEEREQDCYDGFTPRIGLEEIRKSLGDFYTEENLAEYLEFEPFEPPTIAEIHRYQTDLRESFNRFLQNKMNQD